MVRLYSHDYAEQRTINKKNYNTLQENCRDEISYWLKTILTLQLYSFIVRSCPIR